MNAIIGVMTGLCIVLGIAGIISITALILALVCMVVTGIRDEIEIRQSLRNRRKKEALWGTRKKKR